MQMSIVELWDDLLKTDLILPSNIFKSASYLGIPDESRGKIWLHMVDQREKRCGTQHQSDFKVKPIFGGKNYYPKPIKIYKIYKNYILLLTRYMNSDFRV